MCIDLRLWCLCYCLDLVVEPLVVVVSIVGLVCIVACCIGYLAGFTWFVRLVI